jgi:hypothetical protein
MSGEKTDTAIRLLVADAGYPSAHQPSDAALLASTVQRLPPIPSDRIAEYLNPFGVTGNRRVIVK